ncbi:helix-turn-helix transcriptional regulator [Roseovarius phycicola]|uniref:helix-turn-helix transcriptional regulator n=1 Tax=Roseovarius phycicola TaxID=3080976 RepID=UPI003BB041BD
MNVIAENLFIDPATVRPHWSSIFSKTGTSSQIEPLHSAPIVFCSSRQPGLGSNSLPLAASIG